MGGGVLYVESFPCPPTEGACQALITPPSDHKKLKTDAYFARRTILNQYRLDLESKNMPILNKIPTYIQMEIQ